MMTHRKTTGLDQLGPSPSQHRRKMPLPMSPTNEQRYRGLPKSKREKLLADYCEWALANGITPPSRDTPDETAQVKAFVRMHQHSGSRKHKPSMPVFKFTEPKED